MNGAAAREQVPLDWATTQNNLGNALLSLGERENDTAKLKEVDLRPLIGLREQILEHRGRHRFPILSR